MQLLYSDRYDVAISTACGALNYIVVETTSDAQLCVELLRKRQLGVCTFLILDKQRHLQAAMEERVKTPEGDYVSFPSILCCCRACSSLVHVLLNCSVLEQLHQFLCCIKARSTACCSAAANAPGAPRLFDLVSVADAKIKLAFFYALRNTLVAKDLDQASRIAYGGDRRFGRVVTVAGQLIAGGLGRIFEASLLLQWCVCRVMCPTSAARCKEYPVSESCC